MAVIGRCTWGVHVTSCSVRVREATIVDAERISKLICRSVREHIAPTLSDRGAAHLLSRMDVVSVEGYFQDGYVFFVAEEADQLVSVSAIRPPAHLFYLFVDSSCCGRGVGKRMWHHARDRILADQPTAVITVNSSLNATSVYEHFGFVKQGPVEEDHEVTFQPMRWTTAASAVRDEA